MTAAFNTKKHLYIVGGYSTEQLILHRLVRLYSRWSLYGSCVRTSYMIALEKEPPEAILWRVRVLMWVEDKGAYVGGG